MVHLIVMECRRALIKNTQPEALANNKPVMNSHARQLRPFWGLPLFKNCSDLVWFLLSPATGEGDASDKSEERWEIQLLPKGLSTRAEKLADYHHVEQNPKRPVASLTVLGGELAAGKLELLAILLTFFILLVVAALIEGNIEIIGVGITRIV